MAHGLERFPQRNAAQNPGAIGHTAHVRQGEAQLRRVAAADVEAVVVDQPAQHLQRALGPPVPGAAADPAQGLVADEIVVRRRGQARMHGEVEVRQQCAVEEQRRADARAESDHELEALAP
ncbi:MAG TPA: hypothetical protein VFW70_01310, partial [Methylomirabilota bacterium]|nr:hypothetical protein [Methylomirabilota bacterium]